MMENLEFKLLRNPDSRTVLGESPFWDPETGNIWWIDVTGRKLLRLDTGTGGIERWNTPEHPGFVVLAAANRPVIGMETGIYAFDLHRASFELLVPFTGKAQRFNDATVGFDGKLWASTMALDAHAGVAAIHLITDGLAMEPVVEGLSIPNGLAVDIERGRLYYSDSHPDIQNIWSCEIDDASVNVGGASLFANMHALAGRPDGAALDAHGNYWIAGVDGSELCVFDPDGKLRTSVPVPFPAPTKISFFGTEGRSVVVTSKDIGIDGGYLALAELPESWTPGVTLPYWKAEA